MSRWRQTGSRRRYPAPQRPLWRRVLDYSLTVILFGLLVFLAARLNLSETRRPEGVAIIKDGDSIVLGTERIRLRGIDAPEYLQLCRKDGADYSCGRLARNSLVRLVAEDNVSCTGWQHDRYDRLLGDCMAGGRDLNRAQVEAGWAVAYGDFDAEETVARAAKRGIWAGTFERPQDWRKDQGDPVEPRHDLLGSIGHWLRELFRF